MAYLKVPANCGECLWTLTRVFISSANLLSRMSSSGGGIGGGSGTAVAGSALSSSSASAPPSNIEGLVSPGSKTNGGGSNPDPNPSVPNQPGQRVEGDSKPGARSPETFPAPEGKDSVDPTKPKQV